MKLTHLSASPLAKSAWQRSRIASSSPSSLPSRAQGKQPQRPPLPNESFVLLQDSVIHSIPSPTPLSPAHVKKGSQKSREQTIAEPPREEPDHPNPSPLSHHLRSTARLFNLLSTHTEIDHPLCAECTQILLTSLQRQLDEAKKERDGYIAFEKEIKREREKEKEGQGLSKEELEKKIEKLKADERLTIEHLKEAEREREQLDEELSMLEMDERVLEAEEIESVLRHFPTKATEPLPQFLASSQRTSVDCRATSCTISYTAGGLRC